MSENKAKAKKYFWLKLKEDGIIAEIEL